MADLIRASIIIARQETDGSYRIEANEWHGDNAPGRGGSWIIKDHRFSGIGPIVEDPSNAVTQIWIRWTNT